MLTRLAEESVNLLAWRIRPHRREANSYLLRELRLGSRTETRRRIILLAAIWLSYAASAVGGGYLDLQWQLRCLAVPLGVVAASSPPGGSAALDVV